MAHLVGRVEVTTGMHLLGRVEVTTGMHLLGFFFFFTPTSRNVLGASSSMIGELLRHVKFEVGILRV